jgi:hypothetical protein
LPVIAQSPDCCWTLFCLGMMLFSEIGIMPSVQADKMRLHLEIA